jgi:VanZ family protein
MSLQLVRIVLLVLLASAILVLSLLPEVPIDVEFLMGLDKVQHWLAYAMLGFLVLITINKRGRSLLLFYGISVFSCTMYGGLIEVLQRFTGRTPETVDFFVNMFGAAVGGIAALGFIEISRNRRKKRNSNAGRTDTRIDT